jgi:hypothetical protein
MITLHINVQLILRAVGYTIAILGGAVILAIIVQATSANPDLSVCIFWGSMFLGILAVLTDELKRREALLRLQSQQDQPGAAARSSAPVQVLSAPEEHQVHTHTIVDVTCGVLDLYVTRWTDGRRTLHASFRSGQSDVPHHTAVMRGAREQ